MSCIGSERVGGGWGGVSGGSGWVGGQAGGRLSLPLGYIEWCCPPSKLQICTQPTGWVETDTD